MNAHLLRAWAPRIVAMVVGLAIVSYFGYTRVFAEQPKATTRTQPVARSNVTQTIAVSGSVSTASQVRLNFKGSGKIVAIPVTTGQQVNAGDMLAKLDDSDQRNAAAQAAANLGSAQAKYASTANGDDIVALRLAVDQAQQSLNRVRQNYAAAKTNLDSYFSVASADRAAANLTFIQAQSTLTTLQNDLQTGTFYADIRTATTTSNTIGANFQQAQVQSAVLDSALSDLSGASAALKAQIAAADAGTADIAGYGAAQTAYAASLARAQSAIDGINGPLGIALTNANAIIADLNSSATKGDATLNQTRTDASALAQQITTVQQQLVSARSKLGALNTPLNTVTDAITGSTLPNAQNALANAKQSLQAKLDSHDSDVQSAAAAVQSAQASYDAAQSTLGGMLITAPVAGVVASVAGSVGELSASSGSGAFIVLSQTGTLALHGTVGEADVANLKLAQVASITVDAVGTTKRFTGKVTNIDPVATLQQGVPVYGVDVTLDIADPAIRPGMTGTANVIVANRQNVLVVPNVAIRSLGGRRGVQVLRDGQVQDVTTVRFGIANDQVTEVVSGLDEGDLVVLPTPRAGATPAGGGIRLGGGGGGGFPGR